MGWGSSFYSFGSVIDCQNSLVSHFGWARISSRRNDRRSYSSSCRPAVWRRRKDDRRHQRIMIERPKHSQLNLSELGTSTNARVVCITKCVAATRCNREEKTHLKNINIDCGHRKSTVQCHGRNHCYALIYGTQHDTPCNFRCATTEVPTTYTRLKRSTT